MKKLLLALFALSIIASGCGKNNKSTGPAPAQSTIGTNQYGIDTTNLVSYIDNNQFVSVGSGYQTHKFETYKYEVVDACSSKYITCNYSKRTSQGTQEISTYANNLPSLEAKKNELKSIINSATYVDSNYLNSSGILDVYVNNIAYRINFRIHINANPQVIMNREAMTVKQLTSTMYY